MSSEANVVEQHRAFGGEVTRWQHASKVLGCDMHFSVFVPSAAQQSPVPVLFWLSGLTCTDENFTVKSGAQRFAEKHGLAIVAPDTSPRGTETEGEDELWHLGTGAGFYLNATRAPWKKHYQMESYVAGELYDLVSRCLPVDIERAGISGHSMGGHGALTLGLKHPHRFKSISAFSPICAPSQSPWGRTAFEAYLGNDESLWKAHDAVALIEERGNADGPMLLVDQGEADEFLVEQLRTGLLDQACAQTGQPLALRLRPGYDHSYFFIASFIAEHIAHHASQLQPG